ncbi:MAG: energy transducer TonB [Bacteroides sp.]|nr:energy transducer TonB [Bacteroides sp.]MCM1414197.1 energy transducer TonB [Bacteroides sp.]MCM1472019.1 energy transducer TonB [Bacteroides sp.]
MPTISILSSKYHKCAFLAILFFTTALPSAAQSVMMVDFFRPGERIADEAYMPDFVDVSPQFPGGEAAMIRFINSERHYPRDAYESGRQGRVVCSFIVDSDGSILNIRVQRGPCPSMMNEAVRIISNMPRWNAGLLDGRKVPVVCFLTIPFRL